MYWIWRLLPALGLLCAACGKVSEPTHTPVARVRPTSREGCKQTVVNDTISNNLVDVLGMARLGLRHVAPHGFALRYTTALNQHEPNLVDTVYTLHAGTSELEFMYFTPSHPSRSVPVWISATVRDRSIVVYPGLEVGMPKSAFLRLISAKPTLCDTVEVVPSEQNTSHYFIFAHDTLTAMWLYSGAE